MPLESLLYKCQVNRMIFHDYRVATLSLIVPKTVIGILMPMQMNGSRRIAPAKFKTFL